MSDAEDRSTSQDADRAAERAHLLPEELAAGSDDPAAQAEQILADSDRRTDAPEQTRQESSQTDESTSADRAT
ncbi:hypothetical protein [uncultured Friedmanniella sp.]|uniref:hypothetical protein n=1 Tax=uncultured Friedmanniella sp. TaxID=335381 RepID=UPI0035CAE130